MKNKAFLISYKVLHNIFKNNAYSQIELNKELMALENDQDHALITKIVYGVLENNLQLEYYLNQFITKKPSLKTYIVLKIGAFVSLYLNSIPGYAMVNELVELVKKESNLYEVGFTNKVLKLILETPLKLPNETNELEFLSVKYSYPMWLLKKLQKQYGKVVLKSLLESKKHKLKHIRLNKLTTTKESFIEKLKENNITYELSPLENGLFIDYASLLKIENLKPLYTVESLGSMLIVDAMDVVNGTKLLDVCAAPGGKTCYMAEKNLKGSVLAFDIHAHRVQLVEQYVQKMGLKNVKAVQKDATILDETLKEQFDAVLCDAPCSGIGVIQKKPDILLFREEKSIKDLVTLQTNILKTASNYVKKGGTLVYSTCTLLKEENIEVIKAFLNNNKEFELIDIPLNQIKTIKENKTITILPTSDGLEGYFIARLKRI